MMASESIDVADEAATIVSQYANLQSTKIAKIEASDGVVMAFSATTISLIPFGKLRTQFSVSDT